MKIVTVIPLSKGIFKEDLTYFTSKEITPGAIVEIPLRNKKILGIALSCQEVSDTKGVIKNMSFDLRKIIDVKENSIFRDEFLQSGIKLSNYFATQKGRTLMNLMPVSLRENYDNIMEFGINKSKNKKEVKNLKSEKLLFQAPLEDRISFYKTLIRASFAQKQSVFMVLPGSREVEKFKKLLSHGIEQFTFAIHSGMTEKKQLEHFKNIQNTEHPVFILGTAPFLSIPREDIKTIILENENAHGYKNFNRPYLDMRIFVEIYAENINAKLLFADTILRFETIYRRKELAEVYPLSFRLNVEQELEIKNPNENKDLPDLAEGARKKFKILSEENIEEIKKTLEKKQNVFIFSLRKGLATMTVCADCASVLQCENCAAPVVLYLSKDGKKRMYICNKCKQETDPQMKCPNCDSWNLVPLGIGTDTITEEIKKVFPHTAVLKLDKESAKTNAGAEKIIKEFESSNGAVLIGTEMAFFYLKNKIPLSIMASFDSLWSIPNFKISEKILYILISMLSITDKKIIVQTKNENDDLLKSIQNENILSFIRKELELREKLGYPPFERFIKISYLGNKEGTVVAKKYLTELFQEYDPDIFSAFTSKQKGNYATNMLIKISPEKWSLPELREGAYIDEKLLVKLSTLPPDFSVNIDPEDLL